MGYLREHIRNTDSGGRVTFTGCKTVAYQAYSCLIHLKSQIGEPIQGYKDFCKRELKASNINIKPCEAVITERQNDSC